MLEKLGWGVSHFSSNGDRASANASRWARLIANIVVRAFLFGVCLETTRELRLVFRIYWLLEACRGLNTSAVERRMLRCADIK